MEREVCSSFDIWMFNNSNSLHSFTMLKGQMDGKKIGGLYLMGVYESANVGFYVEVASSHKSSFPL